MSLHDVEKSLIEKFLETYTSNWRLPENDPKKILGLEIILTSACNTKCDYCYYKNFSDFLNPVSICGEDILYENTFKLLSWMKEHSYSPYQIDIFSGEFFNMKSWDKILQLLLDNTQSSIMIPTNTTFLFDEEKTNKIEEFLNNYRHRLYLSLSVDGKYLDNDSRPLRSGKKYDDAFYDKMFKFGAKWNLNYHPMISKVHIDKWIDNYKWYIENICKYYKTTELDAVSRIYLLEVRNPDWTHEDLSFLENFIYFLIRYVKNLCGNTLNFINFLRNPSNCNILSSIYAKNYRGLGCSFSNTLAIRMSDMTLVPCHRTSYDGLNAGILNLDSTGKFSVNIENPMNWIFSHVFEPKNTSKCQYCEINKLCNYPCLGVNFEVNRDMYIPVETVCMLEYIKVRSIIKGLNDVGADPKIIYNDDEKNHQISLIEKEIIK